VRPLGEMHTMDMPATGDNNMMHTMELADPNQMHTMDLVAPGGMNNIQYGQGQMHTMDMIPAGTNGAMSSSSRAESQLQMFQAFLEKYAPDSWVTTWNGISSDTKLCWMKSGISATRKMQQGTSPQLAMSNLQRECPSDNAQVMAFSQAVQASFQQLPDKLKQIGQNLVQSLKTASDDQHAYFQAFTNLLRSLKALTPADRQQIAAIFPKLTNVITANEWDQVFDGSNSVVNGAEQVTNAFEALYRKLP
jgi:hypothetical protein